MTNASIPAQEIPCERCGRCLPVCPIYAGERIETLSPRGRLDLVDAVATGALAPGPRYQETLSTCLQCLACADACPKGIDASRRILAARGQVRQKKAGRFFERRLLHAVLVNRPLFALATRLLAGRQRYAKGAQKSPPRHLPLFLPQMLAGRRIPTFDALDIYRRYGRRVPADPDVSYQGRVLFFSGCLFGYVDTAPALAAIQVLAANGFDVVIPPGQTCCGTPAHMSGYEDIARKAAMKNLQALAGNDPVITACATCGSMLQREYPRLLDPISPAAEQSRRLADRSVDIHQFLAGLPRLRTGTRSLLRRVTLHDPCHLTRGQGVDDAVRTIMEAVPGLKIVEMSDTGTCCGGGGLSGLKHPAISGGIGDRKAAAIIATGADQVASGCPGCLLQIRDRLSRRRSSVGAVHPVELLAASYGEPVK